MDGPVAVTLTAPILPGRAEAWRRMCQELLGSRADGFQATCRRLRVSSQRIWLVPVPHGDLAVISIDVANPGAALADLAVSPVPFDRWLRTQIRTLIGVDLAALADIPGEQLLEYLNTCVDEEIQP
jgi:hypothetical protein